MKKTTSLVSIFLLASTLFFGQIGIGTTNPQSILDVNSTDSGILIPRLNSSQIAGMTPSNGELIYKTDSPSGFYYFDSMNWVKINSGVSYSNEVLLDPTSSVFTQSNVQEALEFLDSKGGGYLEKVTENGKTGFRIKDRNEVFYGDTGREAIDLSFSNAATNTNGATGDYAFAAGYNNLASGAYSTSLGRDNISSGAYSLSSGYKSNASGYASSSLGRENTSSGAYSLSSGYKTTSSGSYSSSFGGENTSSGAYSLSSGYKSTSSGAFSISLGKENTSAGAYSFSAGYKTNAIGSYSLAFGRENTSSAAYSVSLGVFNTNLAGNPTSFIYTDRIFSIGIGTSDTNRKDAIEVFKNGKIYADELALSEITDDKQLVTKEYVDSNISSNSNVHNVGDEYLGGVVFYTWDNGNHGFIVADVEYSGTWETKISASYTQTNCRFNGLGSGKRNTMMMYNANLHRGRNNFLTNNPIQFYTVSSDINGDGVNENVGDWFIPSPLELKYLIEAGSTINPSLSSTNQIDYGIYWSSREASNSNNAIGVEYTNLGVSYVFEPKGTSYNVKLIREF